MSVLGSALPTGTVTFLFTDIEGSTRMLQELGPRYPELLAEHQRILRAAVASGGGIEFGTEGDALFAAFPSAAGAVAAAIEAQRALGQFAWPEGGAIKVRMGLHTGEGVLGGGSYVGLDVHRAARIAAAGHGGQILISETTKSLTETSLPPEVTFRDLGEHRMKDLTHPEHLFQVDGPGVETAFPPPRTLDARPNNLLPQLTTFIGREREVAEIRGLLLESRLLTLTGPGGTGKTRLSQQVAAEVLDRFADGVFFVPLASITDTGLVAPTIASALGVHDAGDRPVVELLKQNLAPKELALVLDNFEQIVDASPIVNDLLTAAPRLRVMVTSREALHLSGEQEFPVPPLALPDPGNLPSLDTLSQYDSVALFIQRARAVSPGFEVTNENAPAVAEICARLDGLPLAIELAAARAKLLTPEAMLSRLENRLSLLKSSARDLPARQQTLQGAIDWSYDLLEEDERAVFRRLAVFVRGCTVEAAETVLRGEPGLDTLDALGSLVDKSLLRHYEVEAEPRFQMLMTIREYAFARLLDSGEQPDVSARHAAFFQDVVAQAEPELTREPKVLERLEVEHDNLRAALRFLIDAGKVQEALSMAGSLWRFWHLHGHLSEGRMWLTEAVDQPGAEEQTPARAKALSGLAGLEYWQSDYPSAKPHWIEAREIYRAAGDPDGEGWAVYSLAYLAAIEGDNAAGETLAMESAELFERAGNKTQVLDAKFFVLSVLWAENQWEEATKLGHELLDEYRQIGDTFGVANSLHGLARSEREFGRYDRAREYWGEAAGLYRSLNDFSGLAMAAGGLATIPYFEGDLEKAVRLGGAARAAEELIGGQAPIRLRGFEDVRDLVKGELPEERVTELWEEGRAIDIETAIAEGLRKPEEASD